MAHPPRFRGSSDAAPAGPVRLSGQPLEPLRHPGAACDGGAGFAPVAGRAGGRTGAHSRRALPFTPRPGAGRALSIRRAGQLRGFPPIGAQSPPDRRPALASAHSAPAPQLGGHVHSSAPQLCAVRRIAGGASSAHAWPAPASSGRAAARRRSAASSAPIARKLASSATMRATAASSAPGARRTGGPRGAARRPAIGGGRRRAQPIGGKRPAALPHAEVFPGWRCFRGLKCGERNPRQHSCR